MDKVTVFYLVSILLALYALWLAMFRTYYMNEYGKPKNCKARLPNIFYVVMLIVSFFPIANFVMFIAFIVVSLAARHEGGFYVKSWLFDTLGEKEDKEEN